MASPVDAGRATTSIATAANPWTVNLPASIAAGDTLIHCTRAASATVMVAGTWNFLLTNNSADASDDTTAVLWKKADGTEGATMSFNPGSLQKGASVVYRITGAADPTVRAPEISTVAIIGTGAVAINPPSLSPTGGSKDYLWIAFGGVDGEVQTVLAPTNYSNLAQANSGTAGAVASNCIIGTASRQLTAASEDPGDMGTTPNSGGSAVTIAVHPAATVKSLILPSRLRGRHPLIGR